MSAEQSTLKRLSLLLDRIEGKTDDERPSLYIARAGTRSGIFGSIESAMLTLGSDSVVEPISIGHTWEE